MSLSSPFQKQKSTLASGLPKVILWVENAKIITLYQFRTHKLKPGKLVGEKLG